VISAAEAATLWQLPSPRIGHIRLARHTIPRAPAPPDVARAPLATPIPLAATRAALPERRERDAGAAELQSDLGSRPLPAPGEAAA
jgi:hypothetical protein